jgi:hypothetical protein
MEQIPRKIIRTKVTKLSKIKGAGVQEEKECRNGKRLSVFCDATMYDIERQNK